MTTDADSISQGAGTQRQFRFLRRHWLKVLVAIAIVGIAGYLHLKPLRVSLILVDTGPVVQEVMGTGTLEAKTQAVISSKISGRLAQVLADQGDRVKKGQLLASLDDADLKQQVAMAKAVLQTAKSAAERIKADEARSKAVLTQARRDHERAATLLSSKVSSPAEAETAAEKLAVSEADLVRATAAIAEAESQVKAADETLRYQEAKLADTLITAPFDALVIKRSREAGDVAVPGTEILRLISTDVLWASVWVDETAISSIAPGQRANVVFRSEPQKSCSGEVARLGQQVDRETREFLVDVQIKELPATWAAGQRVEVYIETARHDQALRIPASALQRQDGKTGVWLAISNRLEWRPVSCGLTGRDNIEVLQGLNPGDKVAIATAANAKMLRSGQRVAP